ncbi:hypothetical protein BSKO_04014 [Bryopsis sp. KO-2023]|nr:hypothetical protein BSKO_04014 [Bryopsis sp. KO-2023]
MKAMSVGCQRLSKMTSSCDKENQNSRVHGAFEAARIGGEVSRLMHLLTKPVWQKIWHQRPSLNTNVPGFWIAAVMAASRDCGSSFQRKNMNPAVQMTQRWNRNLWKTCNRALLCLHLLRTSQVPNGLPALKGHSDFLNPEHCAPRCGGVGLGKLPFPSSCPHTKELKVGQRQLCGAGSSVAAGWRSGWEGRGGVGQGKGLGRGGQGWGRGGGVGCWGGVGAGRGRGAGRVGKESGAG